MKITIYDRYIFKQVMITTIVAILLFTVVWIAPEMLLNTIKKTLEGEYTARTAVMVLTCQLPLILSKAFPVGLLLGALFTFDKLSKDSELTIFRAVGLPFWRIVRPVLALSVIISILCFITIDKLVPYSSDILARIKDKDPVSQYIYTQKEDSGRPEMSVIVSKYNRTKMNNVIVLDFADTKYTDMHGISTIYVAKKGKFFPDRWELYDITRYKISAEGIFDDIDHMNQLDILKGHAADDIYTIMSYSTKKEREISNKNLHRYVKLLKSIKSDETYNLMLNKYLQRFFHPFICVLLAVMGCLLGFSKPREQRVIGFTIAIGSIFIYYITLPFFDLLAEKSVLPPLITALFPPLAFLVCIVAFYKSKDL
ncbi:MAG: LptF/LptG family permease [Candidatus Gastranaerophilales bacterium]|nr:LptF/LptG family permease [Candidatus Gastranaerophilales bacterium]